MSRSRPVGPAALTAGPPWASPLAASLAGETHYIPQSATSRSSTPEPTRSLSGSPVCTPPYAQPSRTQPHPQLHCGERGDLQAILCHTPASAPGRASPPTPRFCGWGRLGVTPGRYDHIPKQHGFSVISFIDLGAHPLISWRDT